MAAVSSAPELCVTAQSDPWKRRSRYRFASFFAPGRTVLDLGCGFGDGTALLAAHSLHAVGLDTHPDSIHRPSTRVPGSLFVCALPTALPLPASSFGLITAFDAVERLDHWASLISETARVLSRDGVFLVSTSHKNDKSAEFRSLLLRHFPYVHVLPGPFRLAVCSHVPVALPSSSDISSLANPSPDGEPDFYSLKAELEQLRAEHSALLREHHQSQRRANLQLKIARSKIDTANHFVERLLRDRDSVRNSLWLRLGRAIGIGPWSSRSARLKTLPRSVRDAVTPRLTHGVLYIVSPLILFFSALVLAVEDLCFALIGTPHLPPETAPRNHAATIIIPNWNGADLLKQFLPSLMRALSSHPECEVIVVDNASEDHSVTFLQQNYPQVRVLQNKRNLGFAPAANLGVQAASNDIVVLLNNDMRVEPDFLSPLLEPFNDPLVFAVSSQIFLANPLKPREETGLTEIWWEHGRLRVGHRIDSSINVAYPCAYAGGGSSAFDRRKFLELGGFDRLFHPFYYEDTDLGLLAWKRGWKVLYHPASIVHHEHRGTVGRTFSGDYINAVVKKNNILYCWKNVHDWKMLARHFAACVASSLGATSIHHIHHFCRPREAGQLFRQLPQLIRSRWQAHRRRKIADAEAFRRPLGGYYRDRFLIAGSPPPDRLNILFAAPYPIEPPVHGGAVFMKEAVSGLSAVANVHLVSFVDFEKQLTQQQPLLATCASAVFLWRPHVPPTESWTLTPYAVREFAIRDFAWAVHRAIYTKNIDLLQLEYTVLGQYAGEYRHIPSVLFEHDIAFQALWRRIRLGEFTGRLLREYLRMRLYEPRLLRRMTRVQVCTRTGADYLQRLLPELKDRVDCDVRAGIDVAKYPFVLDNRETDTLLFVGTFRHLPNRNALRWFIQHVFPIILQSRPAVSLTIVGSDPPKEDAAWLNHPNVRLLDSVADVRVPLTRYSVFVCPILSGSGVRVKLLEAFACGIPVVSTRIGAEGLSAQSGELCQIADSPPDFAAAAIKLLADPLCRTALAQRARTMVERQRDSSQAATRLASLYRAEVNRLRRPARLPFLAETSARSSPSNSTKSP